MKRYENKENVQSSNTQKLVSNMQPKKSYKYDPEFRHYEIIQVRNVGIQNAHIRGTGHHSS